MIYFKMQVFPALRKEGVWKISIQFLWPAWEQILICSGLSIRHCSGSMMGLNLSPVKFWESGNNPIADLLQGP
jgi:hypothetical protein